MLLNKIANANGTVISVTGTATLLKDLINTAGVTNTTYSGNINAADLYIEDGDVRVLYDGNTPTASKGILLKQGTTYQFRRTPIDKLRLISTSGTVLVDVQVGFSEQGESTNSSNSSIVTLTGDVEIGAVELKNASDDTRVKVGALTSITSADNGLPITDPIANTVLGTTSGSAVETDASGTIQQYLRGLVKLIVSKITVILNDLSPANAGRSATSKVLPVQVLGADGAILPAVPVLGAGETHIGEVGGKKAVIDSSFTRPSDTTTYAAGEVVGPTAGAAVMTFTNCSRINAGSGAITNATLTDGANVTALPGSFELFLFDTTFTADADNAVFTPTDAELLTAISIPFTLSSVGDATSGIGGNRLYTGTIDRPLPFVCGAGSRNLFGALVVRNAYVPVSA